MDQQTTNTIANTQAWGVDLENRVGVPREGNAAGKTGAHWEHPEQQIPRVKINKTIERDKITPVFGSTCPPRGLSGLIRNFAYARYSENAMRHWLLLIVADRIDVMEGMIEDVFTGKLPHLIKEMGLASELNNRQPLMARLSQSRSKGGRPTNGLIFAGVAVAGLAAFFLIQKSSQKIAQPSA